MRRFKQLRSLCVIGLFSTIAACAQERDPINRVQPQALEKSFFLGENLKDVSDDPEFHVKLTYIDNSQSQSTYTVGESPGADRIRWEVTENLLIARRSYQEVAGADTKGITKDGTIVGAWKIESHFDIRREYNPSTGEELNVVVENSTDRVWQDRKYMRVDWTENLAKSLMNREQLISKFFGGGRFSSVKWEPSDLHGEDSLHFEAKYG